VISPGSIEAVFNIQNTCTSPTDNTHFLLVLCSCIGAGVLVVVLSIVFVKIFRKKKLADQLEKLRERGGSIKSAASGAET